MQKLTRLHEDMTEEEQARTIDHLKALPPGKSKDKPEAGSQLKEGGKNAMDELLTAKEAAAFLKVGVITLAKWRGKKTDPRILAPAGPSSTPGRHWQSA